MFMSSERNSEEESRFRFEIWKAMQEKTVSDPKSQFDRLAALELGRLETLKYLFDMVVRRPDYINGGITKLTGLNYPLNGILEPLGIGSFVQIYIDEVIGYNDDVRRNDQALSADEEKEYWFTLGFKHLGNSDHETRQLIGWMQEHPQEVADYLHKAWISGKEWTKEFLIRSKEGSLKKIELSE